MLRKLGGGGRNSLSIIIIVYMVKHHAPAECFVAGDWEGHGWKTAESIELSNMDEIHVCVGGVFTHQPDSDSPQNVWGEMTELQRKFHHYFCHFHFFLLIFTSVLSRPLNEKLKTTPVKLLMLSSNNLEHAQWFHGGIWVMIYRERYVIQVENLQMSFQVL